MARDEILSRLRERIVAFVTSRVSRDVAEDLAQEVLMLLHEKYGHVERLEELLPLSLQITRFKILDLRRKAFRRGEYNLVPIEEVQVPDPNGNPGAEVERKQMLDRLSKAMAALGPRCRQLFRWKLQEKSFAEIQVLFGVRSINTVYTWDFRCRKELLEKMGGTWEGKP
jgi:RNA polymerase sigma-70 factor (ECF subfamily)